MNWCPVDRLKNVPVRKLAGVTAFRPRRGGLGVQDVVDPQAFQVFEQGRQNRHVQLVIVVRANEPEREAGLRHDLAVDPGGRR